MAGDQVPLSIMVSSTNHDIKDLLLQVEGVLNGFGYETRISRMGTLFVDPNLGNFDNCLQAVEDCDLFFGIITPAYGTGKDKKGGRSITHRELLKAVKLNKLRWFVCHESVMNARSLLNDLSFNHPTEGPTNFRGAEGRKRLSLKPDPSIIKDLKTLDMFEAASREDVRSVARRRGNWVQPYNTEKDVLQFLRTQFGEPQRIRDMFEEWDAKRAAAAAKAATKAAAMAPPQGGAPGAAAP
jgi:hypothetical protein